MSSAKEKIVVVIELRVKTFSSVAECTAWQFLDKLEQRFSILRADPPL